MDKEAERKIRQKKQEETNKNIIELSRKAKEAGMSYGKYVARLSMQQHKFDRPV